MMLYPRVLVVEEIPGIGTGCKLAAVALLITIFVYTMHTKKMYNDLSHGLMSIVGQGPDFQQK